MALPNSQFATTQWTMVWKAAEEDSSHGRPALAEVIKCYWQPLYSYARRKGFSSQDAEDATQEFLSSVISGQLLENADPAKGKFRAYLLTAWKRFLVSQYRKAHTFRRGGQAALVSLDVGHGERQWLELKSREPDPDRVFMMSWASTLLSEVALRLRRDYATTGRAQILDALLPKLTVLLDAAGYQLLADELMLSRSAVKVALHRLRQRYGLTLRELVLETVDDPNDVDVEIHELLQAVKWLAKNQSIP